MSYSSLPFKETHISGGGNERSARKSTRELKGKLQSIRKTQKNELL